MDPTSLPNDIFLLIIAYLSPRDLILSRSVSRSFQSAFTSPDLNRQALIWHYPRCRELRLLDPTGTSDWADVFAQVASRYHYLKAGTPREIEKLPLGLSAVLPEWSRHRQVTPWNRHLQFEEKSSKFCFADTLWTYDGGILIFPSVELASYLIYDLESGATRKVEFGRDRIVRRMKLKGRVLVVEWCEGEPWHQLNEQEMVYRHFCTAYDLVKGESKEDEWKLAFRNEWKIHFLGMPLNGRDRFYSAHNATHYVLYLWQPNRSSWGEDEPIEALAIWDISSPSSYRPSADPTGKSKPGETLEGAKVIRRFSFSDLDFYKIRQRSTPVLRSLDLDANHVYIIEEDHRWIVGQQAGHSLPRLHKVKSTGIPFNIGPRWQDECGADGDVNLSFCQRVSDIREPGIAPCWRHEEFPYLTIAEAVDAEAGVIFSARQCFMLETISINVKPRVRMTGPGYEISLRDDLWQELLAQGKICGDERWLIGENTRSEVVILHFGQKKGASRGKF